MSFTVRKLRDKKRDPKKWVGHIVTALTIAQPLFKIYRGWYKSYSTQRKQEKRLGALKRILTIALAVLLALLLLTGIGKAMLSIRSLGVEKVLQIAGANLETDEHGYTNFLLIGQGDADHDGKNLTDTIMVASIDPSATNSVILLSIPRDTYFLSTEKMGKGKLNSMYRDFRSYLMYQKGMEAEQASIAALEELAAEIGRKLHIKIHHTVKVDFIAFVKAVDTIGGIDVDVPYTIEDYEYPNETYGYEPFIIEEGPRHLDGATALKYARSRHTSSDFGRSARQQQLLGAMAQKAKEEGILTDAGAITSFMKIMNENVETTMSLREMIGAASLGQKLDRSNIITMQLNDRNALYDPFIEPGGMLYTPPRNLFDGAAVLLPVSIPEFPVTWKQPKALTQLLLHKRHLYLEEFDIAVLNAGGPPGTARRLATELIRYGFTVPIIENAGTEKVDESFIINTPEPDEVISTFSTLLNMPQKASPSDLPAEQRRRITIILGRDYGYTPLQNLVQNLSSTNDS